MASRTLGALPVALVVLACQVGPFCRAQEPVLLNDRAGGELELAGENRLLLSGIRGTIALRVGKPDVMIYAARALDNRRDELPVALWLDGSTLRLEALDANNAPPVYLEVAVPPGLAVETDLEESTVYLNGLMSPALVAGRALDVRAGGLTEGLRLDLRGGAVRCETVPSAVELEGREIEAVLKQISGDLTISVAASKVEVDNVAGNFVAELEETTLVASRIEGRAQIIAEGGTVQLSGVRRGAELQLGRTPLALEGIAGGIDLETEADVQFRDLESDLEMVSFGGALRGLRNVGGVRVNTDGATVNLEGIKGPVIVEGRDLRINLRDLENQVRVVTTMSNVQIENSAAAVDVENDFGDVVLSNAAGPLKLQTRDGAVRIADLKGAVELNADGPEVRVSWSEIPAGQNSTVKNERGDIAVGLPRGGRCRVEAVARFGSVESDLPEVRVSDDGKYGNGVLGGANQPVISIDSGGAVYIGPSETVAGR